MRPLVSAPTARGLGGPVIAFVSLLVIAIIWGASYTFTKMIFDELTAWQFLALRFTLAAVVMLLVFWRWVRALPLRDIGYGVVLGALFGSGQLLQTVGLAHTAATISGFITGLYVVFTPLCAALLLRSRIGSRVWISAAMAVIGLAVLALQGVSLGLGEWLTLIGAVVYALHIVGLGQWSTTRNALGLSVVQLITMAVMCIIAAAPGGYAIPHTRAGWMIVLYLAVIAGGGAMLVQTWAQSQIPASRAAVVMATEPVWAAGSAIWLLGEPLTWRVLLGGTLMLAAMFVVESKSQTVDDPAGAQDHPKLAA